jgi:threonylcarbamoyladenosine tRNA methylthiotransferase MtaB
MHPGSSVVKADGERTSSELPARESSLAAPTAAATPQGSWRLSAGVKQHTGHQRALLKVQDGCDAFCTYCIIPRLRPRLRSKAVEVAVAEARGLVRAGHKEIIVTGIFLGAFGRDTAVGKRPNGNESPLAELVEALAEVEGLERLRLSSLEPGDVDVSLLAVLASRENCVPHLHLPLQSGSPRILRRMNRQYTREAYVDMIDRVRCTLDRPAITTDIIVGFPSESEDDFQASLEVARYAGFLKIHAFPFSPREGTAAARREKDFVDQQEVRERMARLAELERMCSYAYRRSLVGCVERVLLERPADQSQGPISRARTGTPSSGSVGLRGGQVATSRVLQPTTPAKKLRRAKPPVRWKGRADRYFEVQLEAEGVDAGELIPVRLDRVSATRTYGVCVLAGHPATS